MKIRAIALSAAAAGTLFAAQPAHADAIDDALAKLPAGEISCEQAEKYWTNDADYNAKVRQARTIARFDSRGPQILDALARVESAANRCGLKGTNGGGQQAPAQQAPAKPAPAQQAQPAPAKPAQSAPAQSGKPVIVLAPQGVPTFDAPVSNVATVRLPDLAVIAQQLLAQYAPGSSLPF
ncbi:hypothetical protein [Corynebacterium sp. HMSC074A01]|uniref:hypothetical protein n=1 Tax=Corynebacterium sp. HMSC074A01 TaxID=1715030 RepID=UPI0008A5BFBA|nr:hypothetical protein [Corynebacterium sp. HMSC074A01]OHF40393.1 hypothetical protein HMPREF2550_00885 [Corynebacterium sp. HMSC074A01]